MRTNPLFLAALMAGSAWAQGAWVAQQHPFGQFASRLIKVQFTDVGTGWIVGADGSLIKTTDGGNHWVVLTQPESRAVLSLSFINRDTGWVTTNQSYVYRTADGGHTWNFLAGIGTSHPLIQFLDKDTGWAAGGNVAAYKSVDGGVTWTSKNHNGPSIQAIHFLNGTRGWLVGQGAMLKNNAANTWSTALSATVYGAFFTDFDHGWVVGANGEIRRTTDGGLNWVLQTSGTSVALRAVHFLHPDTGWIVGDGGVVLKTVNGGANWVPYLSGTTRNLTGLFFVNTRTGWAIGDSGIILRTTTADEPPPSPPPVISPDTSFWMLQRNASSMGTNPLAAGKVQFFGRNKGWALDNRGNLLKTLDGGITWSYLLPSALSNMHSLSFINADTGWVTTVADNSLYRTTNGGATWNTSAKTISSTSLIQFLNADTGWTVGPTVSTCKSVDGGETWAVTYSPVNYTRSFHFVDGRTGWVVTTGNLVRNVDGQNQWTPSFDRRSLRSVFFVDRNVGWTGGDGGALYKTTDGGLGWATQASGTTHTLRAIHFVSPDTGWVVGDHGVTLRTYDGGSEWTSINSGITDTLTATYFLNAHEGWSVANTGAIYHTNGTEFPVPLQRARLGGSSSLTVTDTWLHYRLEQPSRVTVSLRDLRGIRKATLFDGRQPAGSHALNLATTPLASGVYLLDFQEDRGRTTKTLFLP